MVEFDPGTIIHGIKMALVYDREEYSQEIRAQMADEIMVRFDDVNLVQPDLSTILVEGAKNAVIEVTMPKSAVNEQVIEIVDRIAEDHPGYKEYWVLCDEVEDHPEILRSE